MLNEYELIKKNKKLAESMLKEWQTRIKDKAKTLRDINNKIIALNKDSEQLKVEFDRLTKDLIHDRENEIISRKLLEDISRQRSDFLKINSPEKCQQFTNIH